MDEKRVVILYNGKDINIIKEEDFTTEENLVTNKNRPSYVFCTSTFINKIHDDIFGDISFTDIRNISVLCYENDIDNMKEDIKIEYDAIREMLREKIYNNM